MLKVYKYTLAPFPHTFELTFPIPGKILKVAMQGSHPVMWVLVDPDSRAIITRQFFWVETGQEFKDGLAEYIETLQTSNHYVLHLFER